MAALLVWNDQYSVHIPEIDEQHKKLFALINDLYDNIRQGHGEEAVDDTLKALVDYTHTHFEFEEKMMFDHHYPDFEQHCAEHTEMIRRIAELSNRRGQGPIGDELMTFLFDWLTHHILEEDMKYASSCRTTP